MSSLDSPHTTTPGVAPHPEMGADEASVPEHVYARASLEATAGMRILVRYKQKRLGKKPALEVVRGDDFHHDSSEWRRIDQVVDRTVTPARYRKRIVGPDGTVLRNDDGLLADHQGYGEAKSRPPAAKES